MVTAKSIACDIPDEEKMLTMHDSLIYAETNGIGQHVLSIDDCIRAQIVNIHFKIKITRIYKEYETTCIEAISAFTTNEAGEVSRHSNVPISATLDEFQRFIGHDFSVVTC